MFTKCCTLVLLFVSQAVFAAPKSSCYDAAKTQADLNQCADREYAHANRKLNDTYQRILKEYANDPIFTGKLKAAHEAWLKFRDAEMEALYPHENKLASYGSVWPMCHEQELTRLTEEHTQELRQWLKGTIEGDVCAGSVRIGKESSDLQKPK